MYTHSCFPKHSMNKRKQADSLLTISKPESPANPVPQGAISLSGPSSQLLLTVCWLSGCFLLSHAELLPMNLSLQPVLDKPLSSHIVGMSTLQNLVDVNYIGIQFPTFVYCLGTHILSCLCLSCVSSPQVVALMENAVHHR